MKRGRATKEEIETIKTSKLNFKQLAKKLDRSEAFVLKHQVSEPVQTVSEPVKNQDSVFKPKIFETKTSGKQVEGVTIMTEAGGSVDTAEYRSKVKSNQHRLNRNGPHIFKPKG